MSTCSLFTFSVIAASVLLSSPVYAQDTTQNENTVGGLSVRPVTRFVLADDTHPTLLSDERTLLQETGGFAPPPPDAIVAGAADKRPRGFFPQLLQRLGPVGPEYYAFRPMSAKTANRFGNQWAGPAGIGPGFGRIPEIKPGLDFVDDQQLFLSGGRKTRVWFVPTNFGPRYAMPLGRGVLGYVSVCGGIAAVNLRSEAERIGAGWRFTGSSSAMVGFHFGRRTFAEYHYYRVNPVRGFDFSGNVINVGHRF